MKVAVVLITLFNAVWALPSLAAGEEQWRQINVQLVEKHILPGYEDLLVGTKLLQKTTQQFCQQASTQNFTNVKNAYLVVLDDWMGVQHIRFGPIQYLSRYSRFQLWPDRRSNSGKQLLQISTAKKPAMLQNENFVQQSASVQGLPAFERLLYSKKSPSRFHNSELANYDCQLLQTIADNLTLMIDGALFDWVQADDPFISYVETAKDGNDFYDNDMELTSKLLTNAYQQLQFIKEKKLISPIGKKKTRAKRAESWRSRRAIANIQRNVQALLDFYAPADAELSFSKLLLLNDGEVLDKKIKSDFNDLLQQLAALDKALYERLQQPKPYPQLHTIMDTLTKLEQSFGIDLPQQISLALGFNGLDGD